MQQSNQAYQAYQANQAYPDIPSINILNVLSYKHTKCGFVDTDRRAAHQRANGCT